MYKSYDNYTLGFWVSSRKTGLDSLAPARSALAGLRLRPNGTPVLAKCLPSWKCRFRDKQTFRRFPSGSNHKIGFPKPTADGFPLWRDALSRKAGNVNFFRSRMIGQFKHLFGMFCQPWTSGKGEFGILWELFARVMISDSSKCIRNMGEPRWFRHF
jgi:hypothetical protein